MITVVVGQCQTNTDETVSAIPRNETNKQKLINTGSGDLPEVKFSEFTFI